MSLPIAEKRPLTFDEVIQKAREDGGKKFYACFSGGKDSVTTAHKLDEKGLLEACIYVDTSISLNETKEFVKSYCEQQRWKLIIVDRMEKCKSYRELVLSYGFPGPSMHWIAMLELKKKPLYYWHRDKRDEGIVFCSGVRSKESKRRAMNTVAYQRDRDYHNMRWAAPIYAMSNGEVKKYVRDHDLQRSPAYQTIGMSGDCLCGAYSSNAEAELLSIFHEQNAAEIAALEKEVQAKRKEQVAEVARLLADSEWVAEFVNNNPESVAEYGLKKAVEKDVGLIPADRVTWGNNSSMQGAQTQQTLGPCSDCHNECETTKQWGEVLANAS